MMFTVTTHGFQSLVENFEQKVFLMANMERHKSEKTEPLARKNHCHLHDTKFRRTFDEKFFNRPVMKRKKNGQKKKTKWVKKNN